MPYKDRETYLRKQREFYYRGKARAERTRVNQQPTLTPANPYILNTDSQVLENRPPVTGERLSIKPVRGINYASNPLTPLTPQVTAQKRISDLAPARDPNWGIALRFQPAAKEKFQVDDCGNAWRIVKPDES